MDVGLWAGSSCQVPETRLQEIEWANVGKWCSAKSQAPSSTAPGLSLGEKGAGFSRELSRSYHGQEVRGSVYCSASPLHLSPTEPSYSLSCLEMWTQRRRLGVGVSWLAAVDETGALWWGSGHQQPFCTLLSAWTEITVWSFQSNLFGVSTPITSEVALPPELWKLPLWRSPTG